MQHNFVFCHGVRVLDFAALADARLGLGKCSIFAAAYDMKIYRGERTSGGCQVTVNGEPLGARIDIRNYSANGFEWGYDGGAPRQLALAILADHFAEARDALLHHEKFLLNFIVGVRDDQWTLTSSEVDSALSDVVEVPLTLEELMNKVRGGPAS